jgi:hypothetical protein
MPNWCSNDVMFFGDNVSKVDKLFDTLMKEQATDGLGIRPPWKGCDRHNTRFMFSIQKYDSGSYQFDSKWAPAISSMLLIGRRFKVAFEIKWEEMGMSLYGSATFDPSMPDVMMIRDASSTHFLWDEDKDAYIYKDEEYESVYDFMDDVIDEMTPIPISKDQVLREG